MSHPCPNKCGAPDDVVFHGYIAGVQHADYNDVCNEIEQGKPLKLVWEYENKFDDHAIRVEFNGVKLGYIPRAATADIHAKRRDRVPVLTALCDHLPNNRPWEKLCIKVWQRPLLKLPENSKDFSII